MMESKPWTAFVCLLLLLVSSCSGERANLRPRAGTVTIDWVARVNALMVIYQRQGIQKFLEAKAAFSEDVARHKNDNDDAVFELRFYFVDPRMWSWNEPTTADARLFQALMDEIECNPGVSSQYWKMLKGEIYAMDTGSGNPYLPACDKAVLELYKTIATVISTGP